MTHGKTYNKSPRRINHKATKSKTNTGTTALERSVEQTTGGFKALLQLTNFTLGPDATLNTEIHKIRFAYRLPTQSMHQSENIKIKLITIINKDEYSWLILLYASQPKSTDILIFFLFLHENVYCGYSQYMFYGEYPQHMFTWRNKINIIWISLLLMWSNV